MPLVKATLATQIKAALDRQASRNDDNTDPNEVRQQIADDIASAVDTFVKSATIGTPHGPGTIL